MNKSASSSIFRCGLNQCRNLQAGGLRRFTWLSSSQAAFVNLECLLNLEQYGVDRAEQYGVDRADLLRRRSSPSCAKGGGSAISSADHFASRVSDHRSRTKCPSRTTHPCIHSSPRACRATGAGQGTSLPRKVPGGSAGEARTHRRRRYVRDNAALTATIRTSRWNDDAVAAESSAPVGSYSRALLIHILILGGFDVRYIGSYFWATSSLPIHFHVLGGFDTRHTRCICGRITDRRPTPRPLASSRQLTFTCAGRLQDAELHACR